MAKYHESVEDQVNHPVSEDEYRCVHCYHLLGEYPWIGESGEQYCSESCMERAGDAVKDGTQQ